MLTKAVTTCTEMCMDLAAVVVVAIPCCRRRLKMPLSLIQCARYSLVAGSVLRQGLYYMQFFLWREKARHPKPDSSSKHLGRSNTQRRVSQLITYQ